VGTRGSGWRSPADAGSGDSRTALLGSCGSGQHGASSRSRSFQAAPDADADAYPHSYPDPNGDIDPNSDLDSYPAPNGNAGPQSNGGADDSGNRRRYLDGES
jgi:hypothetical protein